MTDLTLLDVVETALTKHGAHSILDNLNGFVSDECWLCHTPIGTIRWLRALVARCRQAETIAGDAKAQNERLVAKCRELEGEVALLRIGHEAGCTDENHLLLKQENSAMLALLREIARAGHHRAGDFDMLEDVRLRGATWLKIQEAIR